MASKPPQKWQKVDPKPKKHFKMMVEPAQKLVLSDYERQLYKAAKNRSVS